MSSTPHHSTPMNDPDPYVGPLHRLVNLILLIIPIIVLLIVCLSARGESSLTVVRANDTRVTRQGNALIMHSGGTMLFSSSNRLASAGSLCQRTGLMLNGEGALAAANPGRLTLRSTESFDAPLGQGPGLSSPGDFTGSRESVGLSKQVLPLNGWDFPATPLEPATWFAALLLTLIVAVNPARKLVYIARTAADRSVRRRFRTIPTIANHPPR
jgi:hypothetical protein